MKQKITKLFVSFLSVILILPQLLQADFIYTNIPATINPLFATVSKAYLNDGKDIVVFIQDMHSNPEVQKSIYKTIDFFDKKYGINKILIEGAPYEKLNTNILTSLKNENNKISEYLLNKGMLTGTEYFLIKSNSDVPIYGLENWETYINNVQLLASINKNFNGSNEFFSQFYKTVIEKTKTKKLLKYIDFDITDSKLLTKINQPVLKYDTLSNYMFLSEIKNNFNKKEIHAEHEKLLKNLKTSLNYESYKNITDFSKKEDLIEYWQLLYKQFETNQEYQTQYKNLFSYLNFILKLNSLNMVSLLYQQNEYFKDFLDDLNTKDDVVFAEKIFILKMTSLFEKIINLSVSEYEYKFFVNNLDKYKQLLEEYLSIEDIKKYYDILFENNKFLDYYKVNSQRNETFTNNILSSLSSKGSKNITIVVAGGFHSSILDNLKEKNLQFLMLTPYAKFGKVTDAYSKIVSSTYEQQMLAPVSLFLANSPLVPEHTRALFMEELVEAFVVVYDETPEKIGERITNFSRREWAEPLSVRIKEDTFNIYVGKQRLTFKIINNRVDFTKYEEGLIEDDTVFIRDYNKKKTVDYSIVIDGQTIIFEIEKDIADNLNEEVIQTIINEISYRTGKENVSFLQQDSKGATAKKISIKTFEKSNSSDLFIDNIAQSNTFFVNKSLLKSDSSVRDLFLEISIIHSILFSFYDRTAFDKDLLTEEDINFINLNIDKNSFGLPNIEKLIKAIETEFSGKEVRVLSQLKRYSGNIEFLVLSVLEKDYLSEYRLPHWKHIVSQYFSSSKGESKKSLKRRKALEKQFFSQLIVDNTLEEPLQKFLDKRVTIERQHKMEENIKYLAGHLADSVSEKEKSRAQELANNLEQNIYNCLELMYRNLPRHMFEKFLNEKGVVADHNFNHSMKLIENVIDIVKTEEKPFGEVNFTIVVYAALMHDLACTLFRDNHEKNSAILASEILKNSDLPSNLQRRIVASCIAHEKVGDRGERVEHKIYEARLIHDADGLSAVMDMGRIMGVWIKSKEPFFFKERTIEERLDLIERDRFLYTEGGDAVNDLLRQFVRMKPSRYLTTGAKKILSSAMDKGQDSLISIINEYRDRLIETYGTTEEEFQQATETIKTMFKNPKYNEILGRLPGKKDIQTDTHDDIFDFSRNIDTDNTLLIDIVRTKEELYRLEKAERLGLNTLAVSFSDDNILSNIPLTNIINMNDYKTAKTGTTAITINGQTYHVVINLNFIKLNSAYSEYMKILTIDAPNIPEELKPEIIKFVSQQIMNNENYSEYIKPLENIAVINFDQAKTDYKLLTETRTLSQDISRILVSAWGDIPLLYDIRKEKGLIIDSQEFIKMDNINAILSAS